MKHYTALSLLFTTIVLSSIVACAVGYVTAGPSSYSYSYDENYFNKYHRSAGQRAQWVQNKNGWILNVKKCTHHNQWNGQIYVIWLYDPKCEILYTAYLITPEMCQGENHKSFCGNVASGLLHTIYPVT